MNPFECQYAYHSGYHLNTSPMKDAVKYFIGKHDFSAFENASRNDREINPVKEIFRADVIELVWTFSVGNLLRFPFLIDHMPLEAAAAMPNFLFVCWILPYGSLSKFMGSLELTVHF